MVVKEECIESWLLCEYEGSMAGHIRPLAFIVEWENIVECLCMYICGRYKYRCVRTGILKKTQEAPNVAKNILKHKVT